MVFWLLLGLRVATSDAATYSEVSGAACAGEYELSATQGAEAVFFVTGDGTEITAQLAVDGGRIGEYDTAVAGGNNETLTAYVPPASKIQLSCYSGTTLHWLRYSLLPAGGGGGSPGPEGKEGPSGKEGPAGKEGTPGKDGSTFTGVEAREISDEGTLYLLGGISGLVVAFCIVKVVRS